MAGLSRPEGRFFRGLRRFYARRGAQGVTGLATSTSILLNSQPLAVMPAEPPLRTPAPELVWEAGAIHDALYDLVKRQPTRLRTIIIARYGLNGSPVAFYREIGIRLRLSGERVRQLHTEALVMLRHAAHSQHLRSLLGYHTVADYEWAETLAQRWLRKRGGRHG